MATLLERIAEIAQNENITIGALERKIGASKGVLSRAIQNGTDIQAKWIERIVENYPQYSISWLITGQGGMLNTVYDRIDAILKEHNISKRDFAKGTGDLGFLLPSIYENARKRNPADITVAGQWTDSLLKLFPEYSRDWILYGVGPKYKSEIAVTPTHTFSTKSDRIIDQQDVPLYDYNATAGLVAIFNDHALEPADFLRIPNLPPVDGAIYVRGESMSPLLKSGDIVMYKKKELSIDSILWGEIYLLSFISDGDTYTAVKYIQKADEADKIRLASFNPSFAPKDIPMSSITALALVKASLTFHTME